MISKSSILSRVRFVPGYFLLSLLGLLFSDLKAGKIEDLRGQLQSSSSDTARVYFMDELAWEYLYIDADSADAYAWEAFRLADRISNKKFKARSHHTLATVFLQKNQNDSALKHFRYAIDQYEKLGLEERMAASFNGLGNVYLYQGVFEKALESYLESMRLLEKNKAPRYRLGLVISNIGIVYFNLENYTKAVDYYLQALKISEEEQDSSGIATAHTNLGNIYKYTNRFREAGEAYGKAIAIYEANGEKFGLANCYANVGGLRKNDKQIEEAQAYYEKAMALYRDLRNDDGISSMYFDYAGVDYARGQYARAIAHLDSSIRIARDAKLYSRIMEGYGLMHETYAAMNEPDKAYKMLLQFMAAKDSLLNEENSKNIARMQTLYETNRIESELRERESDLEKKETQQIYFMMIGLVLMALVGIAYRGYLQKKRSHSQISHQKLIIEEKQKEIVDSINYARRIQQALLAHEDLLRQNLPNHFILFKPKDIVSGDFYWAIRKDDAFYLAVCDSTGHGVPGAFMSLLNISFMNEAISEKGMTEPGAIFDHARHRLIGNISADGGQDGMDGILFRFRGNEISYAAANNYPVLIRKGKVHELEADKMPVGKSFHTASFRTFSMEQQPGDQFYLITDGFADQFGGEKGKKYKHKNLVQLIHRISTLPMAEQRDALVQELASWQGSHEQVDDVLIAGIRL